MVLPAINSDYLVSVSVCGIMHMKKSQCIQMFLFHDNVHVRLEEHSPCIYVGVTEKV